MAFEWDDEKARDNLRKDDISLLEATEVFGDEYSSFVQDPEHSDNEERFLLFGVSSKGNYLVVSFTERLSKIRIISIRTSSLVFAFGNSCICQNLCTHRGNSPHQGPKFLVLVRD